MFVDLRDLEAPEYFAIPSNVVAEYVTRTNKAFLEAKGSDSNMRKLPHSYGQELDLEVYKGAWDSLSNANGN